MILSYKKHFSCRGGLDFSTAELGSPPLEAVAATPTGERDGCIVYDLNRPAATPWMHPPVRDALSSEGADAGSRILQRVSTSLQGSPRQQPDLAAREPDPGGLSWIAEEEPSGVGSCEGTAPRSGDLRCAETACASSGDSGEGSEGRDDVGHLRIGAFRPPLSPSPAPGVLPALEGLRDPGLPETPPCYVPGGADDGSPAGDKAVVGPCLLCSLADITHWHCRHTPAHKCLLVC